MSTYDLGNLIHELRVYQDQADAAVVDNLIITERTAHDNPAKVLETKEEAPNEITIELQDDIVPLSIESYEIEYRLHSIEGDKATFKS